MQSDSDDNTEPLVDVEEALPDEPLPSTRASRVQAALRWVQHIVLLAAV